MIKKEICQNCRSYAVYYKRFKKRFNKLNQGYCEHSKTPQVYNQTCDAFAYESAKVQKRLNESLLNSLESSLISIRNITFLLEERLSDGMGGTFPARLD